MVEIIKTIQEKLVPLAYELTQAEDNKSAAKRARKLTLELEKLFKQYRKESITTSKK